MTVTVNSRRREYQGNGVTTVFNGPMAYVSSHVLAYLVQGNTMTLVPSSAYNVEKLGNNNGTRVTMTTPPAANQMLLLLRVVPYSQDVDITNQSAFLPETVEKGFDALSMQIQQLADASIRSLRLSDSYVGAIPNMFVTPELGKVLYWGPDGIANMDLSGPGDLSLRSDLMSLAGGANLVRYSAGETVSQSISRIDGKRLTVENFGAVGDGVANDRTAFLAMAAATGGVVVCLAKEYYVGNLNFPTYDRVVLVGEGRPAINSARTLMRGGTVLVGGVSIRANEVRVQDLGVDAGAGRGFAIGSVDGLVINTKTGQSGPECNVRNVSSLGPGQSGTSHRILIQGFNSGEVIDCACAEGQYGVVVKSRNFNISNITAIAIRTASVYPKSDTPEFGGDVGDATAGNINISNVVSSATADNVDCAAVYIHASTLALSKVNISGVYQLFGHSPVRIQGPGLISSPLVSSVNVSNILSESAQYGFYAGGFCFDWRVVNCHAINPKTGRLWYMDTSSNWGIQNSGVLITDETLGTSLGNATGTGRIDGIYARRTGEQMVVSISTVPSAIKLIQTGYLSGNARYSIDQALAGQNGAAADTTRPPTFRLAPGGKADIGGRFNIAASVNKFLCNLPITTGMEYAFPGAYIDSADNYQPCVIRLNSFQISIEPELPAGAKFVVLDGISIQM